jgi:hypothetical protein
MRINGRKTATASLILIGFITFLYLTINAHPSVGVTVTKLVAPVEVFPGDIIRARVTLENVGDSPGSFYVGASILEEGRYLWIDLPGWGYTSLIDPNNSTTYVFGDYVVSTRDASGFYGIRLMVWTDSTKSEEVSETYFTLKSGGHTYGSF